MTKVTFERVHDGEINETSKLEQQGPPPRYQQAEKKTSNTKEFAKNFHSHHLHPHHPHPHLCCHYSREIHC